MTSTSLSIGLEDLDIDNKSVAVLGIAGSGKTYWGKRIHKNTHTMVHTDDYLIHPPLTQLIALCHYLRNWRPYVAEGMLMYDYLVWCAQTDNPLPEIIVILNITRAQQERIYRETRDPKKIKHMKGFNIKLLAMWNEFYRLTEGKDRPQIINYNNTF